MLTQRDFTKITTYLETEFKPQFKDELKAELKAELKTEFMDDLYLKLDFIIGELKAMREELAVGMYRQSIHSDALENHEERLTVLERAEAA